MLWPLPWRKNLLKVASWRSFNEGHAWLSECRAGVRELEMTYWGELELVKSWVICQRSPRATSHLPPRIQAGTLATQDFQDWDKFGTNLFKIGYRADFVRFENVYGILTLNLKGLQKHSFPWLSQNTLFVQKCRRCIWQHPVDWRNQIFAEIADRGCCSVPTRMCSIN